MNMKGVSSVIAIILILMIVVALAALAYTWFTGIFASLTSTTSTAVTTTTSSMSVQYVIESSSQPAAGGTLTTIIRNTGTTSIDCTKMACYLADVAYTTCGSGQTAALGYGGKCTLIVGSAPACPNNPCPTSGNNVRQCGKSITTTTETGLQQALNITC